jgi:DNA-binding MarR family transcriptional regulator
MAARVPEPHLSAWRGVLNTHATVVGAVEEALADAGLPPLAWYDVLWAIRRAPRRRIRMAELASSLTVSRGGLTKLADRLEDAGRGLYAVLTAPGEQMLKRMWPVYARVLQETFVAPIREDEAVVISKALSRRDGRR